MNNNLIIAGVDPAFRAVGMVKAIFTPGHDIGNITASGLIQTEKTKEKGLYVNQDDLVACRKLFNGFHEFMRGVDIAIVELPQGSQGARASVGYGVCSMLIATLTIPVIIVRANDVKKYGAGKNANKTQMIEWAESIFPALSTYGAKSRKEHVADAIGCLYAGVHTEQYKEMMSIMSLNK